MKTKLTLVLGFLTLISANAFADPLLSCTQDGERIADVYSALDDSDSATVGASPYMVAFSDHVKGWIYPPSSGPDLAKFSAPFADGEVLEFSPVESPFKFVLTITANASGENMAGTFTVPGFKEHPDGFNYPNLKCSRVIEKK